MRGRRLNARPGLPWAIRIVLVAGAAAALGPSRAWGAEPDIVARVNGEPVTRVELQRMLADTGTQRRLQQEPGVQEPDSKALERLALRRLIIRHLILQEGSRRGLKVSEQEVDQAIGDLRRRFEDLKEFGAWMRARSLDDKSLFDTIRNELLLARVRAALVEGVRLAEGQVDEYYTSHRERMKTAEAVHLRTIAVEDKAAADKILAAVREGKDFDRLARQRSLIRAEAGGDIGWLKLQTLPPPVRSVVGTLEPGETGGPIEQDGQFIVVRLEERRPARPMSLAEARPQIERRLLAAKHQEVLQAWLTAQERMAKIEEFP